MKMMNITRHDVDQLKDPTGILKGERYEFFIHFEVEEDDELYSENGLYIKLIYAQEDGEGRIANYQLFENNTNEPLDFELEEDELQVFQEFCSKNV
ncbi:DUF6509 family protein [Fictibacillus iocasae]|uniref:DUF6509 family protein n=1 Tax=Fictibacillus iocasae TaxID=2715437 RepID=A0ABW2NLD9_9BACL